ncbi:MAG TPA: DEAD/DEAH box helicase [Thermoanaerobaculia bacterium]|nr:DEAD/DEAH box helicase [Thermoanaerobaculia bacterium]
MALSGFHPAVRSWFEESFGEPTPPQRDGWPAIRAGRNTLIAAPTGSGKTLAAFLSAIDALARLPALPDEARIVYVSPLRALSNDVKKNLEGPLAEIRARDGSIPEIRVLVRTGDTSSGARAAIARRPPHILVTTPESLYLMLTSAGGRATLRGVRTVIVDEIHALARDKRGSHLALSLERLERLAGRPLQRIGLSATQKPLEEVARFLAGDGRECTLVDAGTFRELDLAVEVPPSPLSTVCSHEQWEEIYARVAELVAAHRTTLVFVNTRKMAERIAGELTKRLGADAVTSHHGSLSRERRLDAEERLKHGRLRALVATASLELGIDVGDVDLAIQVGATRSIATFLQRVGRSGHALRKIPKGRLFPLTVDEAVEGAALLRAIREGRLDRTPVPPAPLDILAQQIVSSCVAEDWDESALFALLRRAWPYRNLSREDFDRVVALHAQGRRALLHRDGVGGRLLAPRRARLAAVLSGGAIPDTADYQVRLEPDGLLVGTVNEDWAVESNGGDIFQLGNASWRVLRVEPGVVRVADAKGQPPSIPFWLGEAPGRTRELAAEIGAVREAAASAGDDGALRLLAECGTGLGEAAAGQIAEYVEAGRRALGAVPTPERVVLERFFDESGGMQLVVHAPFGSRINRAWGLALRKRFCVGFGFELQAAANEEAIVLSLGPQHSFPLAGVFDYLHPATARGVLVQALLASPLFETRWRWNAQRALLLERSRGGKKVPAPLLRMRANDLLAAAFPQVLACNETRPPGDIPVPMDHPIVAQTIEDCLTEAMDVEGFLEVLRGLRDGSIERVAVDAAEPSPFARGILAAQPYAFLDDAPLEERRTQAVISRRFADVRTIDELGDLDPDAIARVREEAWPRPADAEEAHEALLWIGWITDAEAAGWEEWLAELRSAGRAVREDGRWFAAESTRDPKAMLRGRLEALGPVESDDPLLPELEAEGVVLRTRIAGRPAWCDRRLLARIHRSTVDRLRREIEPVSAADFLRFLGCWQHADPAHRLDGPRGVAEAVAQLSGFELAAAAWEAAVLPVRVRGYRREWLDQLTLSGEAAWARLWGTGTGPIRSMPVALVLREDLDRWLSLPAPAAEGATSEEARAVLDALVRRGASFFPDLLRETGLSAPAAEDALSELVGRGRATADSFHALRALIVPGWRRRTSLAAAGRWSAIERRPAEIDADAAEFVAMRLLKRTGVVFRRTLAREKQPVPWREIARACRRLEMRGIVRGGRFVAGFDGEQYALPDAIPLLREVRRRGSDGEPVTVSSSDPLNFRGILTPDARVASTAAGRVRVA